jgi:hypothetical protein
MSTKMPRRKREPDTKQATYKPTTKEKAALRKHIDRLDAAPPVPRLELLNGKISMKHPNSIVARGLLMEALGTTDADFCDGLLRQLVISSSPDGEVNLGRFNFMLAVVKGIKPNDQIEAMLAVQMAVVHLRTVQFAELLNRVDTLQQQDSVVNAVNKLARTFTAQVETLKRYRTGGEQTVTVQHVSVSEGGQAIVGNVTQAATKTVPEKPAKLTPAVTDARQPAMKIIDDPAHAPASLLRRQKHGGRSSS